MELEIRPEPSDDVRAAIEAALLGDRETASTSVWWRAGVEESVAADE